MSIKRTVLFMGCSITDAGHDELQLGHGYAAMTAAMLRLRFPRVDFTFINSGDSGNCGGDQSDIISGGGSGGLFGSFGSLGGGFSGLLALDDRSKNEVEKFHAEDHDDQKDIDHAHTEHHQLHTVEQHFFVH